MYVRRAQVFRDTVSTAHEQTWSVFFLPQPPVRPFPVALGYYHYCYHIVHYYIAYDLSAPLRPRVRTSRVVTTIYHALVVVVVHTRLGALTRIIYNNIIIPVHYFYMHICVCVCVCVCV